MTTRKLLIFSAPAEWTPAQIPGITAWYRAEGLTSDSGTTTLADQSGEGNNATTPDVDAPSIEGDELVFEGNERLTAPVEFSTAWTVIAFGKSVGQVSQTLVQDASVPPVVYVNLS